MWMTAVFSEKNLLKLIQKLMSFIHAQKEDLPQLEQFCYSSR